MEKEKNKAKINLVEYKKKLKLTKLQKQIIIGTLLGDATIVKQKYLNSTYNIKFEQSLDKKEYIEHLYDIFKDWIGTRPKIRDIKGGNAKNRYSIWFRTYRHISLNYYYKIFYKNGKKGIPIIINKLLSPIVIAYWFMDDGNKKKYGYVLNTQAFNFEDQIKLVKILNNKYKLDARIHRDRNYYLIFIKNIKRFNLLVKPFIIKLFEYKLHNV